MHQCLNCKNNIPWQITVDGKSRNLRNRKYCLSCVPFKSGQRGDQIMARAEVLCELTKNVRNVMR